MSGIPIKVLGLQRTGTNYISKLLTKNFPQIEIDENHGWKHGPYCGYLFDEPSVIVVSKNIYAWLPSVWKYWKLNQGLGPDLSNLSFEEFVLSSPVYLEGSIDVPYLMRATNIVQFYQNAYFHWLSIRFSKSDRKICLVRYEDILTNYEQTLQDIATTFKLETPKNENINHEILWNGSLDSENEKRPFTNRDYYLNKDYMEMYSDALIRFIHKEWDENVMSQLGYRLEKSKIFEEYIF